MQCLLNINLYITWLFWMYIFCEDMHYIFYLHKMLYFLRKLFSLFLSLLSYFHSQLIPDV